MSTADPDDPEHPPSDADASAEEGARAAGRWLRDSLSRWQVPLPGHGDAQRLGRRWPRAILMSLVTGVATGLAVAGLEWVAGDLLLESLLTDADTWVQIVAPGIGLVLAALILRFVAFGASPAAADEYVRNFHEPHRIGLRVLPGRVAAAIATLGAGNAMGFEGPSIYMGAGIGDFIQRRVPRLFTRDEAKVLMVAGAAAGVSAIFKTPATGAIFAIEVPYKQDLASRSVVPALVASASSYITYVAIYDTDPLLRIAGQPFFEFSDLIGAAAIGLLCGFGARLFSRFIRAMKRAATEVPATWRLAGSVIALGALVGAAVVAYDEPLTLGPGLNAVSWAVDPDPSHTIGLIALLFLLRLAATGVSTAGGGVGGLFIPLVVQGALLGRLAAEVLGSPRPALFTAVGAAAFLGAGYRTPIAAVVFVAEVTGQPGLVVPGLIATALAQFLMGDTSITQYQQSGRRGHLEQRLTLPVSAALQREVHTCPPDATLEEIVQVHFLRARAESIPVTEDDMYLGMITLTDVLEIAREDRANEVVRDHLRIDLPVATLGWSLRKVTEAMESADVDRVAVTEADGRLAGIVTTIDLVQLEELLADLQT